MPPPTLTISPAPSVWLGSLRGTRARDETSASLRAQLGLPTDRPVILSGHQATIWHAGILSKYLAADRVARAVGGSAGWIVVDQDPEDFCTLRVPARTSDGRLIARAIPLGDEPAQARVRAGIPPACCPPCVPPDVPIDQPADEEFARRAQQIIEALRRAGVAPGVNSAGQQLIAATHDLARGLVGAAPVTILASRLIDAPAFARFVAQMRDDAERCWACYNDAVGTHPDAGISKLARARSGAPELPLWRLDPRTGLRKRVFADELGELTGIAPRALTLTAAMRLWACDLFIHGTGGGASDTHDGYDRAGEGWINAWLGLAMAPSIVVTATLLLNLPGAGPDTGDLARRVGLAHRAQHDPALLGEINAGDRKRALIQAIAHEPDPHARRQLFAQMHELLTGVRTRHAGTLDELRTQTLALRRQLGEIPVATDRTWPFPLHDERDLQHLAAQIDAALHVPLPEGGAGGGLAGR